MNIRVIRLSVILGVLLLAGCDDDDAGNSRDVDAAAMTAEKYHLVDMAIDELIEVGLFPGDGQLIVSDQTAMSWMVERYIDSDENLQDIAALDSLFPYEVLPWTPEEADLAFVGYYQANREPLNLTLEGLDVLDRDITLLMNEQFDGYMADGEDLGWETFYQEFPQAVGYVRLGNPAIFEDTGIALVHVDFLCDAICGIGFYALFRREGNEWVFDNWYADWVS